MEWIESIREAITYIEENITEELSISEVANKVNISPFYFQKGFAMLCGYSLSEYIKKRRLSLAGSEVVSTNEKIIDLSIKYGYDSPDSFTKAFSRFHGVTPSEVRRGKAMVKSFAPLKIKFSLEGGFIMEYKIVEKDEFKVVGVGGKFKYESAVRDIQGFWSEYNSKSERPVCGMYGINMDETMGGSEFEYYIADNFTEEKAAKEGCVVKTIPKFTWAIFPCHGNCQVAMPEVNKKIFSEWLPNNKDYEIAAGYNIEMYSDPSEYKNGVLDDNYYSEVWIPVKRK